MLLEQYRPEIVLVLILFKLSSHLAFSMTNSSRSVCNGHGRMNNASIDGTCVCEAPYTGEECQLCNKGYYGDPSNGSPCYLSCSQHKLLSEFTHAGVGIDSDWLSRQGSFQNTYCLWFVAPGVSVSLSENESVIFNKLFNRIRNHQSDSNHSINSNSSISFSHFNISLYFNTTDAAAADLSIASRQSNCFNETVLIYDGIPSHLISLDTVGADVSMTSSSLAHEYSNSNVSDSDSPSTGRLLRVFTGNELRNGHVTIQAPVLTVVYFYKGFGADSANAHSTSAQTPVGFNLTVSVDDSEEEEEVVDGENGSQEDTHDEECLCLSPPCNCTQPFPLHYSTLIPSLTHTATSSLEYLTDSNTTMRLPSSLKRFHHSAVYDACTDLLWLFGGVDLEGRVFNDLVSINLTTTSLGADCDGGRCDGVEGGEVIEVMSVGGDGSDRPMGRYAHSTVLLPCSEESNSSKMLLFGGFTSRHTPANDLWMFDTGSHEWTRLSNALMARASHTAVLVGGAEMMVVIGGVKEGVAISSRVMVYSLGEDQWELWETNTLDMPGVYGHSSAYDAVTHSILVYGGYLYSRPSPVLSSSLYSLDLTTRKWTQVVLNTDTVPARLFHSMVLNGDFLLIYGGLVSEEQQHSVGLGGVCASDDVTLIDLRGESIKTIAINIQGDSRAAATSLPKLWGHQSTVRTDGQIVISGGMNTHASDTISLLLAPTHLYCHLAQTQTDCVYMKPDCQTCVSRLDNIQFLGCYNVSDTQSNSLCNSSGGYFPDMPFPSSLHCSQVDTCEECLTMDVAISMGCLWCECNERCVDRQQECTCGDASSVSNSSIPDVCYLEVCRLPSCEECTNHSQCRWLSIEIRRHMTRTNVINVSPNPEEWGCYDESIFETIIENLPKHTNNSLEVCPISCHHHTSCATCVDAYSPNGGHLMCVWSSYRKECMSVDGIPLLCADKQCGDIVTDRCPQPCSQFSTCDTCLQDSRCLWLYDPESRDISCVDVTEPEELDDLNVNETLIFYLECPVCENNCSNHGVCQPNLTCVCDVGYIGPHCSVECLCNGHSYCANETEVGRRDCLQCLHNTQGVACHRCLPLTVGSAIDGGQCVPCSEYCHGNSEVCLTENEYLTLTHRNLTLSASVVGDYVLNGPSVEQGLCVDCGGFSRGPRCSSCADGYYNSNSNVEQEHVICIECACNGHDVGGCDEHTGICICQNNTFSQMCNDRPCNIRQQVKGVKGPSWLSSVPCFNLIQGTSVDYMHCVLLGVCRQLLKFWFKSKYHKEVWYIGSQIKLVDKRLLLIKPPLEMQRIPRSLEKSRKYWKAHELRAWLLHYSPVILYGILPTQCYQHHLLLVEGVYLLLKDSVSKADILQSSRLLRHYCFMFSAIYGERHMSANVHYLLHLPEAVKDLGPLWSHSCFPYEGANGEILKFVHGTQSIDKQCNHCVSGYIGQPVNNGQCYKRLNIDTIDNFTLSANHTVSLALGPNYLYSDVDVHVTFVVVTGTLLIYSTTDNNAVKVATNTVSGTHEVRYDANALLRISRESSQLYHRHDDAPDSLLRSIFHNDFFHGVVGSFSGGGGGVHSEPVVSGSSKHEIIRKQISQSVSLSSGANIQQVVVSERQTLRIPHTSDDFLSSTHYFTILARGGNAMFFVYFEQNAPRLNLFVFFGAFFSSFILFSTIIISIWRVVHFISEWRRRRRARRRQQRRRHRPFSKVYVYFGDATIYKVKRSDPTKKLLDSSDKSKGTNKTQNETKLGTNSSGEAVSWVPKPTRRDARRKNQSKKLPNPDVIELELKSTNTLAVANYDQSAVKPQQFVTQTKQQIFGEEIRMRPVCAQPTRDELACVTTYIVRLPSKKHPICAASSLVDYQRAGSNGTSGGNKKKRRVNFKRNNRCAPEVSHS